MSRPQLEKPLIAFTLIVLLVAFGKTAWNWARAIPSADQVRSVKYNMTRGEVESLLGKPAYIRKGGSTLKSIAGWEYWHYERRFDSTSVQVDFDPSGRVMSAGRIR